MCLYSTGRATSQELAGEMMATKPKKKGKSKLAGSVISEQPAELPNLEIAWLPAEFFQPEIPRPPSELFQPEIAGPPAELSQPEIRRHIYIKSVFDNFKTFLAVLTDLERAVQSDHIRLLVGPNEELFKVPRDLLTLCSPVFDKMCTLPFKESIDQLIKLPEDEPSVFEDLLIWLHSYEPRIPVKVEPLIGLAVLADKYQIWLLRNQTSDAIRAALSQGRWGITPYMAKAAYASTPTNSILRRLLSLGLVISGHGTVNIIQRKDYDEWELVFSEFSDLGWDYFFWIQMRQVEGLSITSGGACRFHDHSDVFAWEKKAVGTCPYPNGAPLTMPEKKVLSLPAPKNRNAAVEDQVADNDPDASEADEEDEL